LKPIRPILAATLLASSMTAPALAHAGHNHSHAPAAAPKVSAAVSEAASKALHALFASEWERWMKEEPTWASSLADRRYNDKWKDLSPQGFARRLAAQETALKRLSAIQRMHLTTPDQLNYDLFKRDLEIGIADAKLHTEWMPLSHMGGIHSAHDIVNSLRFETVKDYQDWIARMRAFPAQMDQTIALMREGMKRKLLPPQAILSRVPEQLKDQLPADPTKSPFYQPFEKFPASMPEAQRAELRKQAASAIAQAVIPSYRKFETFYNTQYLPAAPKAVGLRNLPGGDKLYAHNVRYYTTTTMHPHRIHELGLSEVARIRKGMEAVMAEVGFKGTLNEFFASLKSDPRFFKSDAQALLDEYRAIGKQVDPKLATFFKRLPKAPYRVEPVPADLAPNSSAAYYNHPAEDGSRPGTFYANLYKPEKRPTYEMVSLFLHEAVPGHHLQIALAMEQGALPNFRKNGYYGAYVEGWGLYAESLGDELGLYSDPYVRFGRLNMEMRRALRLVLDTGLHHEGWSREKSIQFFLENAAKTEMEATNEVDRYLAWPGQALSYKVGEIKIQELRARAAKALGPKFDIREFHEQVLDEGALPLDVLEARLDKWVARSKAGH
jgi:uncharacterized protein (DUF885 family)